MNLFSRLCLVLSLVLPGLARAETIGVRSGDHNGFTRLVIQVETGEDWRVGRVDGGFEFRPGRDDISYRLDRVFDRIARSRIADVRDLGDGRLYLAVDCACHAAVDELADGQVVLDIVAGSAREPGTGTDAILPPLVVVPQEHRATAPEIPAQVVLPSDPPRKPVVVSDRAGLPLTLPRIGPPFTLSGRGPASAPARPAAVVGQESPGQEAEETESPESAPTSGNSLLPEPVDPDRQARIAQTETLLLEQIARAAAQGLLDADMSEVEQSVAKASPQAVDEPAPPAFERPLPPVAPRGHVAVETGVDRAASERDTRYDETDEGDACIDPSYFDISSWGGHVVNGTDIGAYRSHIVGEFDIADGAGVTALARNYVYITFGAEAMALTRRYPESVERPDLLYAMAEVMDRGQATAAADLVDQMACAGATALWATLAQPTLRPGQTIKRSAVALEFSALPAHLRRHLGPGLADTLLASGDRETADLIRASIARASITHASDYSMLSARFALDSGDVDQATATLDDVVAAGDATLPDALLQRVEATLASGGAVAEDIVVLLDSLAIQFRGTETARQMADAGIRARASASDFSAAFAQLSAAGSAGLFLPERGAVLRAHLFERLTQDTDDTVFLRLLLPRIDAVAGLPTPVRRALATRLLDVGFAGAARTTLDDDGAMPEPQDRVLLARAALLERRPAVAIGYLAGLSDAPAMRLRADALALARDHTGAMRAYEDVGDQAEVLRAAWQGGLWPDVARLDQGPIGAAARLMDDNPALPSDEAVGLAPLADVMTPGLPEAPVASDPGPVDPGFTPGEQSPLAAAQALISQSEAVRNTLNALLDVVRPPESRGNSAVNPGS